MMSFTDTFLITTHVMITLLIWGIVGSIIGYIVARLYTSYWWKYK